jgi:hypothetical protein
MQLAGGAHRAFVALTLVLAWASCTFPSVEYEPTCAVPASCQNDITNCTKQADGQHTMCLSKCTTDCAACDTDFDAAVSICVAQCENCSANSGCINATDNCKALLGAP